MSDIKVSIVIPIYNVAKYLQECVRSAMTQTLKELEIICVNDGSTDDSLSILQKLQAEDKRIIILNKSNSGYGDSMNKGMQMAKGKYTAILESDDYILPTMMEDLYDIIEKSNADFVKSNFYLLYGNGKNKTLVEKKSLSNSTLYGKVIDVKSHSRELFMHQTTNWTGLYRTDFLRANNICHNITPGASYQDTGFCFGVYTSAKTCIFVDKAYYYYRQDNPNSSINNKSKVFVIAQEYDFIRKNLENAGLFDEYKGLYTFKKFDAYFCFNYNRIAYQYKEEFLQFMSEDFRKALKNNEFDRSYFSDIFYDVFMKIAYEPKLFYINDLRWRIESDQKRLENIDKEIKQTITSKSYKIATLFSK